jgi:hypothetical protein
LAETLAKSLVWFVVVAVVLPACVVGVEAVRSGLGWWCQAPCWVLREQAVVVWVPLGGIRVLVPRRAPVVGWLLGRVGVGVCWLRIAQWMRASLWSSC